MDTYEVLKVPNKPYWNLWELRPDQPARVVAVSSDRWFLDRVCEILNERSLATAERLEPELVERLARIADGDEKEEFRI
jgi:hypothetical protein